MFPQVSLIIFIICICGYPILDCRAFLYEINSPSSIRCHRYARFSFSTRKGLHQTVGPSTTTASAKTKFYKHILAILTVPRTSVDRIANEAILETCMRHVLRTTNSKTATSSITDEIPRISVILRRQDGHLPKLNELRGYVGEVYSMAWDCALGLDSPPLPTSTTPDAIRNNSTINSVWNTKAENNGGQILDVIGRYCTWK